MPEGSRDSFKIYFPRLYRSFVRREGYYLSCFRKLRRIPKAVDTTTVLRTYSHQLAHRHYSLAQLVGMLSGFQIEEVLRTGLVLFPLLFLLAHLWGVFFERRLKFGTRWLMTLAVFEDSFQFGPIAYNLALRARRIVGYVGG